MRLASWPLRILPFFFLFFIGLWDFAFREGLGSEVSEHSLTFTHGVDHRHLPGGICFSTTIDPVGMVSEPNPHARVVGLMLAAPGGNLNPVGMV